MQGTPQPLNEHKFMKYPPEETFYVKKNNNNNSSRCT